MVAKLVVRPTGDLNQSGRTDSRGRLNTRAYIEHREPEIPSHNNPLSISFELGWGGWIG
jgi:hypothetical protein